MWSIYCTWQKLMPHQLTIFQTKHHISQYLTYSIDHMHTSPISVIITGTTGMVGEWVLHMCLASPHISKILIINRSRLDLTHPKLTQIIHEDLGDLTNIQDQLEWYDACYWCLGTTSLGKSNEVYEHITYDLTMWAAHTLAELNPWLVFCYVSALGADRSQTSRLHRSRIKGKTEADLATIPWLTSYSYRLSYIQPISWLTHTHSAYHLISWMYPLIRSRAPWYANTQQEIGESMIAVTLHWYSQDILEPRDIRESAKLIG